MKGKGRLVISGTLICRIPSQAIGKIKRKANRQVDVRDDEVLRIELRLW